MKGGGGKQRRRAAALAIALLLSLPAGLAVVARRRLDSPERFVRALGGEYLGRAGVVLQQAENDCGAAAMKMIFDHHGIERPLATWNAALIDHPRGSSMLRMRDLARACGLEAEGWRVAERDLPAVPLPAIALVDSHHYVVLERIEADAVIYADPALGRVRMNRSLFLRKSGGRMLLFRTPERSP